MAIFNIGTPRLQKNFAVSSVTKIGQPNKNPTAFNCKTS